MPRLRDRAPYLAYRAAAAVGRGLPFPLARATADTASLLASRAMPGRRAMVARHLRRVRPELEGLALERAVAESFASYGRYWLDSFRLPGTPADVIDARMSHVGVDHLDDALALGKGVILAVPHLGGWDFGGAWLAAVGRPPTAVVEPVEPPELFAWFVGLREALGMRIVPLGPRSATEVLRTLRAGGIVLLVSDRDLGGHGVEVELFGERTTLPGGPATLALRSGAPLMAAAVFLGRTGRHDGVILRPIDTSRGGGPLRDDVARVTQDLAHDLGKLIRMAPEQWHLFQPNWPSDRAGPRGG